MAPRRPASTRARGAWNRRERGKWISLAVASLGLALAVTAMAIERRSADPEQAVRAQIAAQLGSSRYPSSLRDFYRERDDQPLWLIASGPRPFWRRLSVRPEALRVMRLAGGREEPAAAQDVATLARIELGTSAALASYVRSLGAPHAEPLAFIDPDLAPPADEATVLRQAAGAASLGRYVDAVSEVNPIYRDLAAGLMRYRRTWSGLPQVPIAEGPTLRAGDRSPRAAALRRRLGLKSPATPSLFDDALSEALRRFQAAHGLSATGELDASTTAALNAGPARFERLIKANLNRAKALPPVFARRFVLVNVAARELWVYEDGRPTHSMRVVVGARDQPTPMMVGLLRYLVFNPYWNVPMDKVRTAVAPHVLKEGTAYLQRAKLEVLSGWEDSARILDPAQVDWEGVSRGRQELRVRQRPGPANMMGRVKFMAPNKLGIYLHDTPNRAAFKDPTRLLSAGCVRLESAEALTGWLLGAAPDVRALGPDQEAYLDEPVPLYITYLTAAPSADGVAFFPDVYGKDGAVQVTSGTGR